MLHRSRPSPSPPSFQPYTHQSALEVAQQFGMAPAQGLSPSAVQEALLRHGPNIIQSTAVSWWHLLGRQFRSPFIFLLLGASLLALSLQEYIDALMIFLFVGINVALGFFQEYRSQKTIQALRHFIVARVRVRRQGEVINLPTEELVPGDVILVGPGDIIPADMRFIDTEQIMLDESILTGESASVIKNDQALARSTSDVFAARNIGFAGTTVVSGQGQGIVIATGPRTTVGGIVDLSVQAERPGSLEKGINQLSVFILRLVAVTLVIIFIVNAFITKERTSIPELVIFLIALAVSVIPEALPTVIAFSLSRGALRLAHKQVVVKKLTAIEELGSIQILCTDKTGTITENKLMVADIYGQEPDKVLFYGSLGSSPLPTSRPATSRLLDPHLTPPPVNAFDQAIFQHLEAIQQEDLQHFTLVDEIPFDPERRRNTVLVRRDQEYEIIVRGAPEAIMPLCKLSENFSLTVLQQWIAAQGKQGRRVFAVASKVVALHATKHLSTEEINLRLRGLISLADPLKPTSKKAIQRAKALGVSIKILTGDSREVAGAVAYQVGLISSPDQVITGNELELLSSEEKHIIVDKQAVFARVSPRQKYEIIKLLQEKYAVGFLGEGINDAPALSQADVGITVQGAADVSVNATDIVLLNKSLLVIIEGIKQGRIIFSNIIKYINATLASNIGNFYALALASFVIDFLPLLPVQILLINLLSDFPMIAMATDNVDVKELQRPKRYHIKDVALLSLVLGLVSTVFDFIFFGLFYRLSPAVLQTNWFIGSILTELFFLFSIRTRFVFFKAQWPSVTLASLSVLALLTTLILPFTSLGHTFFHLVTPTVPHLSLILLIVLTYFIVTEGAKAMYYRSIDVPVS